MKDVKMVELVLEMLLDRCLEKTNRWETTECVFHQSKNKQEENICHGRADAYGEMFKYIERLIGVIRVEG